MQSKERKGSNFAIWQPCYKGTWKNKKKMPKIVNAFNPVCPHCNYQTINIKDWNHHYTSCTLKYSK